MWLPAQGNRWLLKISNGRKTAEIKKIWGTKSMSSINRCWCQQHSNWFQLHLFPLQLYYSQVMGLNWRRFEWGWFTHLEEQYGRGVNGACRCRNDGDRRNQRKWGKSDQQSALSHPTDLARCCLILARIRPPGQWPDCSKPRRSPIRWMDFS